MSLVIACTIIRGGGESAAHSASRAGSETELGGGGHVAHIAVCLLVASYTVTKAAVVGFLPAAALLLRRVKGIAAETLVMTRLITAVICGVVSFSRRIHPVLLLILPIIGLYVSCRLKRLHSLALIRCAAEG